MQRLQRRVLRALPLQGLKVRQTCATGVTMGMDRREMVKAAAATILAAPLSAFAFGDSPKTVLAQATLNGDLCLAQQEPVQKSRDTLTHSFD